MDAHRPALWPVAFVVAIVLARLSTVVADHRTQARLTETNAWVEHTSEVKVAIAESALALERGDRDTLRAGLVGIGVLVSDNTPQEDRVSQALALTGRSVLDAGELRGLLDRMRSEEDALMRVRLRDLENSRHRGAVLSLAGTCITVVLVVTALALVIARRRAALVTSGLIERERGLLKAIVEQVHEGVIAVQTSGEVILVNAAARALVGEGLQPDDRLAVWRTRLTATYEDGTMMRPEDGPLARAVRGESVDDVVYRIDRPGAEAGTGAWVSTSSRPIRDESGRNIAAVATLRDITQQRSRARQLEDLSLTDELTGLLNRRGFMAAAAARLEVPPKKGSVAVLYADINGLKRINDQLGHEQGDRVIADAASTLRGVFRGTDVLGRLGGDEFAVLLSSVTRANCEMLVARLHQAIAQSDDGEGKPYRLSMSVGLAFAEKEPPSSIDEILAEADRRMYESKHDGRQSLPVVRVLDVVRGGETDS